MRRRRGLPRSKRVRATWSISGQRVETGEEFMKAFAVVLVLVGLTTAAQAQDGVPDLKGTWSGKGKSVVFGNNQYHPGQQTANDAPRIRDIEVVYTVDGQEGRLVW